MFLPVSFAMYSPVIIYTVNHNNLYCTIVFPWVHGQKLFHTSVACVMYVIPLFLISVCYFKIWLKLRESKPGEAGTDGGQRSKRMRRALRLILIVVITFAMSWLLEHALLQWLVWDPTFLGSSPTFRTLSAISKIIAYCNSAINPFIYPFAGTGFMKHIVCFKRRGQQQKQTPPGKISKVNTKKTALEESSQVQSVGIQVSSENISAISGQTSVAHN